MIYNIIVIGSKKDPKQKSQYALSLEKKDPRTESYADQIERRPNTGGIHVKKRSKNRG